MGIFDKQLLEIESFVDQRKDKAIVLKHLANHNWPSGNRRDVVLGHDTAIELGSPSVESVSTLIWAEDRELVADNRMTLVGPGLDACMGQSISFGKVVTVAGKGFGETDIYDRYRALSGVRYDLDLKGFMLRAASQYQREWSRISHQAMANGFSLRILGTALIEAYKRLEYIDAVEILFVTSGIEDVKRLSPVAQGAARIVSAMNKMLQEFACDCGDCEYNDICDEVSDLRLMRQALLAKGHQDGA